MLTLTLLFPTNFYVVIPLSVGTSRRSYKTADPLGEVKAKAFWRKFPRLSKAMHFALVPSDWGTPKSNLRCQGIRTTWHSPAGATLVGLTSTVLISKCWVRFCTRPLVVSHCQCAKRISDEIYSRTDQFQQNRHPSSEGPKKNQKNSGVFKRHRKFCKTQISFSTHKF